MTRSEELKAEPRAPEDKDEHIRQLLEANNHQKQTILRLSQENEKLRVERKDLKDAVKWLRESLKAASDEAA